MTIITVLKKGQNLGDNDVEMLFYHKEKHLLDQQNKLHTSQRSIDEWITLMREDSTKHISSCPRKGHTS